MGFKYKVNEFDKITGKQINATIHTDKEVALEYGKTINKLYNRAVAIVEFNLHSSNVIWASKF